jgi:erythronate-4-phosphate dehydrogenase
MRIVADDKIPFLKGILEPYSDIEYLPGQKITNKILKDTDALLIRTRTKCTEELLKDTAVKFIGTATIGFDHIDTQYCEKMGIFWTNAPGCNSSSVQQYIAAALLKLAAEFRFDLSRKTLGIIGVGNVGSKVEKVARLLGMNVLLNDPPRARAEGAEGFVSFKDIINNADIITLHVPLNVVGDDQTYHLFGDKAFRNLKKGAWFINSSRGEVTDTIALRKALDSQKIAGAIIDVWEHEPDIDLEVMRRTFLSTPHIAGYSTDGKANGTSMVVNALCRYFGLPLNDWYPDRLPEPTGSRLFINGSGKSTQEIITEAVLRTYDIDRDNINLRFSPADFEKQRGEYPLRREFPAFSVVPENCPEDAVNILKGFGFRIL